MEGLDEDGGLWYEYNHQSREIIKEKHWWPQAEALIGFCNAWQLTGNDSYKNALMKNWHLSEIISLIRMGEWIWGVDKDGIDNGRSG